MERQSEYGKANSIRGDFWETLWNIVSSSSRSGTVIPMAEEYIKSGNKRCLFDEEERVRVRVRVRKKKPKTAKVLDFDVSFQDDNFEILESLQRFEKERASRAGNDQSYLCHVEKPEDHRVVGSRGKMPVRKQRMRLIPENKVDCNGKAGDDKDDGVNVLFEDLDWKRIGLEDIDNEEDPLIWRSAAEELHWRLKTENWMKDLMRLIDG